MRIYSTAIPDVLILEPRVFGDARGYFYEVYQAQRYANIGIDTLFVQDNHSGSCRGTLRGLHYQIRQAQAKLVRVVAGEIFDVAVDLRKNSPTFGRWTGAYLTAENRRQIWVPAGFAHGFYVVSEWAELVYKTSDFYAPEWERSVLWNDREIGVEWPLLPGEQPLLSGNDRSGVVFRQAEVFEV